MSFSVLDLSAFSDISSYSLWSEFIIFSTSSNLVLSSSFSIFEASSFRSAISLADNYGPVGIRGIVISLPDEAS